MVKTRLLPKFLFLSGRTKIQVKVIYIPFGRKSVTVTLKVSAALMNQTEFSQTYTKKYV